MLLAVVSVALLIFVLLVFWVYRISLGHKRIALELEQHRQALESKVRERTADLIDSEARYKALSELSPVGVFGTDTEGNCRYVNKRWCQFSGMSRESALGKGWIWAIHPADRKRLKKDWAQSMKTQELFNSEYRYITPDGRVTWLYSQCSEELNNENEMVGYIGTVTDITEHKVLQEQLRLTQKMDALGKLTGGIAHDYNNMLAVISGFSDLLRDELQGKSELLGYIDQIIHASERGAILTKKLLSFSRREASDAVSVDINKLLLELHPVLARALTPRIQLKFKLSDKLWPVFMDKGDLEDAIINMSINAMHAITGNGQLIISTRNQQIDEVNARRLLVPPGKYVLLGLSDTGEGMDQETREKLFEPFFTTKGDHGTGLGLTQVYGFVERSHGTIQVRSELGRGAQFTLYFPRHSENDTEVNTRGNVVNQISRGSETILIVDDESSLLVLAEKILGNEGSKRLLPHRRKRRSN